MLLSRWNLNPFTNFLRPFGISLAPCETYHPFCSSNPQLFLLDTSNSSGLKYLPPASWLFSYIFEFHLPSASQVIVWKRLTAMFTDPCCQAIPCHIPSTHWPANSLSWIHSALSWFQSPIFPTEMLSLLTWKTLPFSRYKHLLPGEAFLPSSQLLVSSICMTVNFLLSLKVQVFQR